MITETPDEAEINKIKELAQDMLPKDFAEVLECLASDSEAKCGDIVFYGTKRIIDENTRYVPGANLLPLGFFTFASTLDGDAICIDMNDPYFSVRQISHSILNGEDDISLMINGKMRTYAFNYKHILKFSARLATSFSFFESDLAAGEVKIYDDRYVTDFLAPMAYPRRKR